MTVIVAYGGGTDSTALLIGMLRRGWPAPHAITTADTGGEKPYTYWYIDAFSAWLVEHSYPAITMVKKGGNNRTLEEDCLIKNMLPSVAYGYKSCSQKFKVEPQEKWANNDPVCRATWKSKKKVTKLIGYNFGEVHRAKFGEDKKYIFRYPLIEWEWKKEDAEKAITQEGLPLPGKSSCFFCPHNKKPEIVALAERYPDLAVRALRMEQGAHLKKIKGLGRRFSWTEFLFDYEKTRVVSDDDDPFDEKPCGCYD